MPKLESVVDDRVILEKAQSSSIEFSHQAWLKGYINVNTEQKQRTILRTSSSS